MKTVKPDKISILQRTFEHEGTSQFVLSLLVGFDFDQPRALISEVDLWKLAAEVLAGENCIIDEGNVKVRGEVVVNGNCYPPGEEPVEVSYVRVELGRVDKRLAVIGDRFWKMGVPSSPIPFREMPVDWQHAFGGEGFAKNPVGKGMGEMEIDGHRVLPLPNIENPKRLVKGPEDKPDPAGFGALDFTWPQRFKKAGTYDTKWLETRYPGYAKDMDPTIFNAACEDQYLDGYFEGGEPFVVENMHPERPRIEGTLPDVVTRAFITQRTPEGEVFRELQTRLDTVRLLPNHSTGILVFRAVHEVAEDDAADIIHLVTACEAPGKPRTVEHYQEALALRLDKEKGALMALKNEDLMPDAADGYAPRPELMDVQTWVVQEGFGAQNMRRRMQREVEEARARLVDQGLNPDDFGIAELPMGEPMADPYDVDAIAKVMDEQQELAEKQQEELDQHKEQMEQQARAAFAEQGLDYEEEVEKALKDNAGPPKFDAEKQVEMMASLLKVARDGDMPIEELEKQLEDPEFLPTLKDLEKRLKDLYVTSAHIQQPFERLAPGESDMFRAEIEVAQHNEIALEQRDFSGADLSQMNLDGMALSGAFMESVDLTGTSLRGANLEGAVLAHAMLDGTDLTGARLTGCNLGGATIKNADLSDAQLVDAVLSRAKLEHTKLSGAVLERVNLHECEFGEGIDFTKLAAKQTVFVRLDVRNVCFAGADLSESALFEVDARGVDFSGANVSKTGFIACRLDGANFQGAQADMVQFVYDSSAEGADFSGASLEGALFRSLNLRGAKLDHAKLDNANLANADFTEASLYQARARNAIATRALFERSQMKSIDLLGAILQKARFLGADLTGANLFGADLAKVVVDGSTILKDAEMKRSRQIPKAKA